jgi:sulfate transport system substrate-binding protein
MSWLAVFVLTAPAVRADVRILNVSYDPTRELYREYNAAFAKDYKAATGQDVTVIPSHGGSGSQARRVAEGVEADVVTLALAQDIDMLVTAKLITTGWQDRLPNHSVPFTSTIVFLVRHGNPKGVADWPDLVKPGVAVVTPNPKSSGGARWNYLAAYGWALRRHHNDAAGARAYLAELFRHVPSLESTARAATSAFVKGQGDVLIAWESEALYAAHYGGGGKFEVIYPSLSITAEPPVAVVDRNVDDHGTRAAAEAYLKFAYTPAAQAIAARHFYRPTDKTVLARFADQFKPIEQFPLTDLYPGGWDEAQRAHFADGGVFDRIVAGKR